MGTDKALIRVGAETIAERASRVLSGCFDDFYIVAGDLLIYDHLGRRLYSDLIKGAGTLGGILTALYHSPSRWCFVAACDMPLLDADAVRTVAGAALDDTEGYEAVVPSSGGRLHPMHGAYSKALLPRVEKAVRGGDLRVEDLVRGVSTRILEEDWFAERGVDIARSVANVNTPEELERLVSDD